MTKDYDSEVQSIGTATLTPIVRQALGSRTVEVTDWQHQRNRGGASRADLFRFEGIGTDDGETVPWSIILKAIQPLPDQDDPSHTWGWKREVLAYQSGLLDDLPGDLAAPRCFGVCEQPDGGFWIWMEDVQDDLGPKWPLEHYGVAARHIGQFNGAYLAGRPIPAHPWLSRGRWHRELVVDQADLRMVQLRDSLDHPLVRRVYRPAVTEMLFRICEDREVFLSAVDRLPKTLCHHDAYSRNLFARRSVDGGYRTVAIDWSNVGTGTIGEELCHLMLITVIWFDVEVRKLSELNDIVFDGYLSGLRDAGWQGDGRMARLGYTAISVLAILISPFMMSILAGEGRHAWWRQATGRSVEETADHWAELWTYILGLEEEARRLMASLS